MGDESNNGQVRRIGERKRISPFRLKYRLRRASYAERDARAEESVEVADPAIMRAKAKLEQQVAALDQDNARLRDIAMRARADLDNANKRFQREKAETVKFANERLVRDLIPVLDNLERAISSAEACTDAKIICDGVHMVLNQFLGVCRKSGLECVVADGQQFDPHFHEAVGTEECEDVADGQVLATLQKGYILKGRVVRPAMVRVARAVRRTVQAEEAVAVAPSRSNEEPASCADPSASVEAEGAEVQSDKPADDVASE